jgi:hypothetical protein
VEREKTGGGELTSQQPRNADLKTQPSRVDRRGNVGDDVQRYEYQQEPPASASSNNPSDQPSNPVLCLAHRPTFDVPCCDLDSSSEDLQQNQREQQTDVDMQEDREGRRRGREIGSEI